MYYHTCPCCGSNLDPDDCCNCLFRIRGKGPKWSGMDGVRTRSPQEVCPCPNLGRTACLTALASFRWSRRAAPLSLCGRAKSPERRCLLPGADMLYLRGTTRIDGGRRPPVDIVTFGSPCQTLSTISDQEFFKWLDRFCSCAPRIYRCLSDFMLYLKNQKVLYSQKCQGMLSCLIIL